MKKPLKKIEIEWGIGGNALVNYNGNRPHKRFKNEMYVNGQMSKNGSFAKEHTYNITSVDENGVTKITELIKKIISENLLRKHVSGDENSVNADKLMLYPELRYKFLSQPNILIKGFAALKKEINLKCKTGLTVIAAEQTSNTVTWLETRTSEGLRDENSLFFKETCGQISYKSEVIFDLNQIKFLSSDDNYDRAAFKEVDVEGVIKAIDDRYGEGSAKYGNWGTTHLNLIGEQGIVLSSEVVAVCVRETIKRILSFNILRAGAYAKTTSIRISFNYEDDDIDLLAKPKFFDIYKIEDYDNLVSGLQFGTDFISIEAPAIEKIEKKPKEN